MVWSVQWEGQFVVGGDGGRRLTPNFRLREFRRPDGTVKVHRELVSAVQLLRTRFGAGVAIRGTDEDGLGALIAGRPVEGLLKAADTLEAHKLFAVAEREQAQYLGWAHNRSNSLPQPRECHPEGG